MKKSSWGLAEVLVLWVLMFLGIWAIDRFEIGLQSVEFFREHFFIFIKEPLLQSILYQEISTLSLKIFAMAVIALIIFLKKGNFYDSLSLQNPQGEKLKSFTLLFMAVSLILALLFGMDPLLPDLPSGLFFSDTAFLGNSLLLVSIVLVAPVTEEIFFRGFMYPAFARKMDVKVSIFLTSFLFALVHWPQLRGEWVYLLNIFLVGLLITSARAFYGSTRYAIFLHAFYNFSTVAAGFIRYEMYKF